MGGEIILAGNGESTEKFEMERREADRKIKKERTEKRKQERSEGEKKE